MVSPTYNLVSQVISFQILYRTAYEFLFFSIHYKKGQYKTGLISVTCNARG
jgi:hypothetical protein